jgi:putative tricarboxylic transport membrane protein
VGFLAGTNPEQAHGIKNMPWLPLRNLRIIPSLTRSSKPLPIYKSASGVVRADLAVALGIIVLGIGVGVGSFGIPFGAGYDRIGPRFFPSVVAAGLTLLGSVLAAAALRAKAVQPAAADAAGSGIAANRRALGFLAAALLLNLLLLERAGFVVASSALYWLAARGFGSERPVRDAVIALGLSLLVYAAFTRGLGLPLPRGILAPFF